MHKEIVFIIFWDKVNRTYHCQDVTRENLHSFTWIAVFGNFDMAYQYVSRLNCTNDVSAYSKWTVSR